MPSRVDPGFSKGGGGGGGLMVMRGRMAMARGREHGTLAARFLLACVFGELAS